MTAPGLGLAMLAGEEIERQIRKTAEAFGLDQRALAMAWFMYRAGRTDYSHTRDVGDLAAGIAGYTQVAADLPAPAIRKEF